MVIERVEISVVPGRESEFELAMKRGCGLLARAENCSSVALSRGIENPSNYLLLLHWNSIDAHMAFTRTADFSSFRELAGPYFAQRPAMAHFEPIATE